MLFCRGGDAEEYSSSAGGDVGRWVRRRNNENGAKETRWTQGQLRVEADLRTRERRWNWADGSKEEGENNEEGLE